MRAVRRIHIPAVLLAAAAAWGQQAQQAGETPWLDKEEDAPERLGIARVVPGEDFLYRAWADYENFGIRDFQLPETSWLARRNHYGPMGNFLLNGYDSYRWLETRANSSRGDAPNSTLSKANMGIFQQNLVARESHKGWATALILGEEMRTKFTPLTLSMAGINGVRLDAQRQFPRWSTRFTALASRWTSPVWTGNVTGEQQDTRRTLSMLMAAHSDVQVGRLVTGGTLLNYHNADAYQESFNLKGQLQSGQVKPSFVVVKFSDDSPRDEEGGAVVNDVLLVVDGVERHDLQPTFVRINSRNPTALGRTNRITGQFSRTIYNDGGIRFADYFYRLDQLAGESVDNVNLEELERFIQVLSPAARLEASGDWVIMAWFDLRGEPSVRSVQVRALVGNDYRIDVVGLFDDDPRQRTYEGRWSAGGIEGQARAEGNVQDLSNLGWVHIDAGAWTGRYVVGWNGSWEGRDGRIRWEYARSFDYFQYPDGPPGHRQPQEITGVRIWKGEVSRHTEHAYYVTAEWGRGLWEGGAEVFSLPDRFNRHLPTTSTFALARTDGFVEDNDDNDSWPDAGPGDRPRHFGDKSSDPDGVFPGKDEDNDGIPDTNRNQNDLPDYEEAFLLFYVEPDEYVYGRDWNHNGVADEREDDLEPDFPYQLGQAGAHVYGRLNLTSRWFPGVLTLGLGRLDAEGIANGGRNDSDYGQLIWKAGVPGLGQVRFETLLERVHDDVANPYYRLDEILGEPLGSGGFTFAGATAYHRVVVRDPLEWRNSIERQHYLQGELQPLAGLRLWGNVRHSLNSQKGGVLIEGRDLGPDEISLWTSVLKAEYIWEPSRNWQIFGQAKGLILREDRASVPTDLQDQSTFVPIVKGRYVLTPRTDLWLGVQGLPGLPLVVRDRADGFHSREERVWVAQLTNKSPYLGYDTAITLGVKSVDRDYQDPTRELEDMQVLSIFLRVLLGYTID